MIAPSEASNAIQRIAKALCYQQCRAALCKDSEGCFNSYPGPGYSWFESFITEARTLVAAAAEVHAGTAAQTLDQQHDAVLHESFPRPSAGRETAPEGWKLVPLEVTDEMDAAAIKAFHDPKNHHGAIFDEVYRAMLASAPPAPINKMTAEEKELDRALCNFTNQVSDPFEPVTQWTDFCWKGFKRLTAAWSSWSKSIIVAPPAPATSDPMVEGLVKALKEVMRLGTWTGTAALSAYQEKERE